MSESLKKESKNDYYEVMEPWDLDNRLDSIYGGEIRKEEWSDGEIRRLSNGIKDVIDTDKKMYIRYGGYPYHVGGVYKSTKDGTPLDEYIKIPIYKDYKSNTVCIPTRELSFIVYKYDDEWYVIEPKINYGVIYKENISYRYLCNGYDGLQRCLRDILKKKSD